MNIFKLVSFTFITLIMCVSALGSTIYKWKDKNGVVHYSQNAPIGQETEIITTKTPRSAETNLDSETDEADNEEEDDAADASAEDDEDEGEEKTGKAVPVATKDQATCDKALKAIEDLQNNPIVTVNGKVMTIEEKNTQLSNMDEIVKVHCP
jgi:hypothetical protein